jgi:transcriptional regulator with XRE-family HTH domain
MPRPKSRDPERDLKAALGEELAAARIAAGYRIQQALADQLGFDRSVITKAESGDRVPTPDVLSAWLKACGVNTPGIYVRLAALAITLGGPIPSWFEAWLAAEGQASLLRYWSPILFPGVFHTARYARALLVATQTDISDDAINALVEAKLNRGRIFDRADPPEVLALIDELVLRRLIGSPEVMCEQLTHIVELAERPNICVQIVPTAAGATAGLAGEICLATIDGAPRVLHTDAVPVGHTTDSQSTVYGAAVAFERTRGFALSRGESRTRMLEAIEVWNV